MCRAVIDSLDVRVFPSAEAAARQLAAEVARRIRAAGEASESLVLGLATGRTPIALYAELVRLHREEGLSFAEVVSFNLDEYRGVPREHPQSYWSFMHRHLFDHVDIPASQVHLPDGMATDVEAECTRYEASIREAGGVDLQVLGIGRNGHIGFNEPGSARDSRTREVTLGSITRQDAAPSFGGLDQVPTHAISVGCGTILDARHIALLGFGANKAPILRQALQGPVTAEVPASYLQEHRSVSFLLDTEAASEL